MNKLKSAILISIFAVPLFTGFSEGKQSAQPLNFFPEITFSSSAEFNKSDEDNSRVCEVEQEDEVVVKFKIVEWILSKF